MSLRFRKSVKILPGIRVNVGLKGASLNVGARGASVSVGKQGVYSNFSIPGTGISFREKVSNNSRNQRVIKQQNNEEVKTTTQSIVLDLLDDGSLSFKDKEGNFLDKKIITLIWKQQSEFIKDWLEKKAEEINDMDLITTIHYDMPNPNNEPQLDEVDFEKEKPIEPKKVEISKPSFLKSLFSSRVKQKYKDDLQKAENDFIQNIEQYKNDLQSWNEEKIKFSETQNQLKVNFSNLIRTDINVMSEYIEKVLQGLDWARETLVSYEIDVSSNTVHIDIDLPEIEDIPQKTATIAATGKKLNIKNKSEKQLRLEYATHIHAIALRVAAYTFATLPSINIVIISGYSQRLDSSTAQMNDEYLYSVKFNKNDLSKLNFNKVELIDPLKVFDNFENIRKMTATGIFKEIEPFKI